MHIDMRHRLTRSKTFVDANIEGLRAEFFFNGIFGTGHHEHHVFALLIGQVEIGVHMPARDDEGVSG